MCMFSQGLICCEVKSVQILRIRELLQNNQLRGSLYSCDAMKTEIEIRVTIAGCFVLTQTLGLSPSV